MFNKGQNSGRKNPIAIKKNPLEALTESGLAGTANIFDQFFGDNSQNYEDGENFLPKKPEEQKTQVQSKKKEGNLFDYTHYHEKEIVKREISSITDEIKRELVSLKNEAAELTKDAEKLTMEPISENPGIYHERFLEVILSLLRNLRAKVNESRTWLQAMVSRKKKRGSAFAVRSKDKGTQYSLSQELTNARSVQ